MPDTAATAGASAHARPTDPSSPGTSGHPIPAHPTSPTTPTGPATPTSPARLAGTASPAGPTGAAGESRRHAAVRGAGRDHWHLREVVLAWLAARLVVGAALALTKFVADNARGNQGAVLSTTDLLGWDAGWYKTIAEVGYSGAGAQSRRFFPLLPLLVRALARLPGAGAHVGVVLVVLVNVCALAFALLLVRLARTEGFTDDAVSRLIWFTALAPPAFVLVMGYAEALAGLLAVAVFLAARRGHWELAGLAGLLGGLCRPLGLLLAVPVLLEAARGRPWPLARRLGPRPATAADRPSPHLTHLTHPAGPATGAGPLTVREAIRRLAAVLAPLVGAGLYVAWSARTFGDGLAPFTLQRDAARHGSTADPLIVLWHAARGAFSGQLGTALHVPWILLALAGLVVMGRRLPVSYTVWCALVLAALLTGSNLDSAERYIYGAFPFLLVAALVTARREVFTFVLAGTAAAMTVYATLAFTLAYVP